MTYKTTSIDRIFAQIFRDFKPANSGWIQDAVEWVGEAIDIMKCHTGYVTTNKTIEVIDSRVKLPCALENLLGIEYQNKRLQRSGGINTSKSCSCLDNLVCTFDESYTLNPNYIQTNGFSTGCITVYYEAIELDCNGFPTIIDDAVYRTALEWYLMMKMIGRGFKHQTFNYQDCEQRWEKFYPRAQNRCRMPDIDGYEMFKKSWVGVAKNTNMTNQFFNNIVANPSNANGSALPGTLVETFDPLGPNINNL